ncbi:MAG: tetratricopeptide repeat protein [Planctomycetota bacterium]
MKNAKAAAGLVMALALSGPAMAQENDKRGAPVQRHLAWRKELVKGNLDPLRNALKHLKKDMALGGRLGISIEDAMDLQNLELQLPSDGSASIVEIFGLPAADLAFMRARTAPSRRSFEAVLANHPGHRLSRRAIAMMDADEGKWVEARREFERLVSENGNDAETRHRFAFAAYYKGEIELALDQWGAAIAADPGCADAWYGIGVVWLGRGLFESAERALTKALEFDLVHWRAREGVIQAMVGQKKMGDAKRERGVMKARATQFPKIGDQIKVAVLPRAGGASITREALLDSVPWLFRIELFDQARPGGKPIKIMELRRDGEAFAWGEISENGDFRAVKPLTALPELEQVLEEAK